MKEIIISIGSESFNKMLLALIPNSNDIYTFLNHRDAELHSLLQKSKTVSFHIAQMNIDKGGSDDEKNHGFSIVYPFLKYLTSKRKINASFFLYSFDNLGIHPGLKEVVNGDCFVELPIVELPFNRQNCTRQVDIHLTEKEVRERYNHEIKYVSRVRPNILKQAIRLKRNRDQSPKQVISNLKKRTPMEQLHYSRYHILLPIIDDEQDQREAIVENLSFYTEIDEKFDVELAVFETDKEFIQFLDGTSFKEEKDIREYGDVQAVILDWQLFETDNDQRLVDLIREIIKIRPNIHIYILTKSTDYDSIITNNLVGFDKISYHVKGEDYEGLWLRIKSDIENRMETPFWKAYLGYSQKGKYSWHTPGHSGGQSFKRSQYIRDIYDFFGSNVFRADLSVSVDELGSLFSGSGKVQEGMDYAARVFGTKHSFFVTNGSSTSNKIMLQYLLKPGDTVIVDRNCHKSVHYGLIAGNFKADYLNSEFSSNVGLFAPPSKKMIFDAVEKNLNAKLLILTGCTYDGVMMDLKDIISQVKEKNPNIKVMIDEAWFCYSSFHNAYDSYSALKSGADYVTHSAHKVLSAFSQASFIHVNDKDFDLAFFMEAFCLHTSTSPQYNLMASLELSALQMEMEGFKLIDTIRLEAIQLAETFNRKSNHIKILTGRDLIERFETIKNDNCDTDPLKIVIDFAKSGLVMDDVLQAFKDKGIQVEKDTKQGLVLLLYTIGSSASKAGDLLHLLLRLDKKADENFRDNSNKKELEPKDIKSSVLDMGYPDEGFHEFFYHDKKEKLSLEDVFKKIEKGEKVFNCHLIVPYPPGIPILVPGTQINKDKCEYLLELEKGGGEIHGLIDKKIVVVVQNKINYIMEYPGFFDKTLLEKREQLLKEGFQPYPYEFDITHKINAIRNEAEKFVSEERMVSIAGRIFSMRTAGKAFFADLKDNTGKIQLYLSVNNVDEKSWRLLTSLSDIGDYIQVEGVVFTTKTGELSIKVSQGAMLAKSVVRLPASKETDEGAYYQVKDPDIIYRERYIYWNIDEDARNMMILRSKIISLIRNWMINEGFLEVQTPTIEMVYGGAEARPFETNIWALSDHKAYLRISPELYLKRFIVGGFDKVFSICQNFRNEGIDKSHNPEFSMMEWYEVGTDYHRQMERFEQLTEHLVKELHNGNTVIEYDGKAIDFKTPWKRISVVDAIREYVGIDVMSMDISKLQNWMLHNNIEFDKDDSKGILIVTIFEELCEKHLIQPTFIIDHPVEISPLTKEKRGNVGFVERFEPFVNAMEIGNAYSELTDPVEQYQRLFDQRNRSNKEDDFENHPIDMDFIKAIGIGMPPTGGVGYGVDRIIMLLLGAKSIREIIPFPMMKPNK